MTASELTASQFYLDQDMLAPEETRVAGGIAVVMSRRCPGKATPNEDAAAVIAPTDRAAVLIVADGLGGTAAGEQASKLTVQAIDECVRAAGEDEGQLRTAILNGIERANAQVQQLGSGAGTTLALVEITGREVRPYHVGDSMIIAVGGRGKLKLQTISHSPVGYGVESGLLNESEAMHHEHRHIISNFVGSSAMRIEIGSALQLAPRDTVLIASDGLFDNLMLDEIIQLIRRGPLPAAARQLTERAQRRMQASDGGKPSKPDDLTLTMYRPRSRNTG